MLFSFLLFRVSEKALDKVIEGGLNYAGEKVVDILGQPVWNWLVSARKLLSNDSEAQQRWQQFQEAFTIARANFTIDAPNRDVADKVAEILSWELHFDELEPYRTQLEAIAFKLEEVSLLQTFDIAHITDLCIFIAQQQGIVLTPRSDVEDAINLFLRNFLDQLYQQPIYRPWLREQAEWETLRPIFQDSLTRYLEQMINHHQDLDFIGIPNVKNRNPLHIPIPSPHI